jgi:hypothetical protein
LNISPSLEVSNFISQTYALYKEDTTIIEDGAIPPSPADNWISSYLFLQKLYVDKLNNNSDGYNKTQRRDKRDVFIRINNQIPELGGMFVKKPEGYVNPYRLVPRKETEEYKRYERQMYLDSLIFKK